MTKLVPLAALVLAACSQQPPAAAKNGNAVGSIGAPQAEVATAPTAAAVPVAMATAPSGLAGRWIGVEGMYLVVTPGAGDRVALEMQWSLDEKGTFAGRRVGDGIAFTRNNTLETLKPSDGNATGLKYLAGKKDCLTVKPGEGYCRS